VTPDLRFLEDGLSIAKNFEAAAARWNQLNFRVGESLLYLGCQTGGPGLVASDGAVFDADFHGRTEVVGAVS
jgi:hypothetical protein